MIKQACRIKVSSQLSCHTTSIHNKWLAELNGTIAMAALHIQSVPSCWNTAQGLSQVGCVPTQSGEAGLQVMMQLLDPLQLNLQSVQGCLTRRGMVLIQGSASAWLPRVSCNPMTMCGRVCGARPYEGDSFAPSHVVACECRAGG